MVLPLCLTTIGKRGTGPTKKRKIREDKNVFLGIDHKKTLLPSIGSLFLRFFLNNRISLRKDSRDYLGQLTNGRPIRIRSHHAFLKSFSIASFAGFTYVSLSFGFSILPAGLRGMLV